MEFVFDTGDHEDLYYTGNGTKFHHTNNNRFSSSAQRKSVVTGLSDIEFTGPAKSSKSITPVKYVRPLTASKKKAKTKSQSKYKWFCLSNIFYVGMVLRLLFMEGGVIDFYKMENVLENRKKEYSRLTEENIELRKEIHLIQTSKVFQKKLAREHLGVIGANEYLVLFGK